MNHNHNDDDISYTADSPQCAPLVILLVKQQDICHPLLSSCSSDISAIQVVQTKHGHLVITMQGSNSEIGPGLDCYLSVDLTFPIAHAANSLLIWVAVDSNYDINY